MKHKNKNIHGNKTKFKKSSFSDNYVYSLKMLNILHFSQPIFNILKNRPFQAIRKRLVQSIDTQAKSCRKIPLGGISKAQRTRPLRSVFELITNVYWTGH